MYARVARFEGAEFAKGEERIAQEVERMQAARAAMAAGAVPEGIGAEGLKAIKRMLVLADPGTGNAVTIAFCESEDDLQSAHRALDAMSPVDGGPSGRVGVDLLQVVFDEQIG